MPTSIFQYEMLPSTWFVLSSLLLLAVFFRFNRFWSIRNFDILGLIFFTPGLLYIAMAGGETVNSQNDQGYIWLAFIGAVIFVRLILDAFMVRRPLLEPNLSSYALTFSCIMLTAFMVANEFMNKGDKIESPRTLRLEQILTMRKTYGSEPVAGIGQVPGYAPFQQINDTVNAFFIPSRSFWNNHLEKTENLKAGSENPLNKRSAQTNVSHPQRQTRERTFIPNSSVDREKLAAGNLDTIESSFLAFVILILHSGIILSIILIGHCHFGNVRTGVAAAFFYLLLPYTSQFGGNLEHLIPGLFIIMAIALYRRPICSGILIGLAGSLVFYPFFLIPLWASFYYKRGLARFLLGTLSSTLVMLLLLLLSPSALGTFGEQTARMFGYCSVRLACPDGLWACCPTIYRFPIVACFGVICFGLILWPTRKNLATLISCSALLMLAVQFWVGNYGGLFMAWYMPALILTIFRPNLEDRVASSTVVEIYH